MKVDNILLIKRMANIGTGGHQPGQHLYNEPSTLEKYYLSCLFPAYPLTHLPAAHQKRRKLPLFPSVHSFRFD